jgi:hypothetical protein
VAALQSDPQPDNNTASVSSVTADVIPVYGLVPEEGDPGGEWSDPGTSESPSGRAFFGEYNNQSITLMLTDLQVHDQVWIEFDLFILRSWDGNVTYRPGRSDPVGPDLWEFLVDGQAQVHTSFSNWSGQAQAYPGQHPGGSYPSQSGAEERGTLGYDYLEFTEMDAIYPMRFRMDHSSPTLVLTFQDLGLQEIEDESWGLANVQVTLTHANVFRSFNYLPAMMR